MGDRNAIPEQFCTLMSAYKANFETVAYLWGSIVSNGRLKVPGLVSTSFWQGEGPTPTSEPKIVPYLEAFGCGGVYIGTSSMTLSCVHKTPPEMDFDYYLTQTKIYVNNEISFRNGQNVEMWMFRDDKNIVWFALKHDHPLRTGG